MTGDRRITYFAYDLVDESVERRLAMFRAGGARVTLLGFHRSRHAPPLISGVKPTSLGQTEHGNFLNRILLVLWAMLRTPKWWPSLQGADAIVARNLECLAVAAMARWTGRSRAPLVYEILDIHRLLSDPGIKGRLMRGAEALLIRQCAAVITSSPAFVREHLQRYAGLPPVILVENKVLALDDALPEPVAPLAAPPWRIGWFGRLRCRRSLAFLADLANRMEGRLQVELRGSIDPPLQGALEDTLSRSPQLRYHGRYSYAQLPVLYGEVHFAWGMDFFEEGLNSSWLLPNRLYEGCANGAVVIALRDVETGKWLDHHGIGLTCGSIEAAGDAIEAMTQGQYAALKAALAKQPRALFVADRSDCRTLVSAIVEPRRGAVG